MAAIHHRSDTNPSHHAINLGTLITAMIACGGAASTASAQLLCGEPAWSAEYNSVPGIQGSVSAITQWDPDGPGPATPKMIFAGKLWKAAGLNPQNIVAWDPATSAWSQLGLGIDVIGGTVNCLVTLPTGELVAAGSFKVAGGDAHDNIAKWDGTTWSKLSQGPSLQGMIYSMAILQDGSLVVAGTQTHRLVRLEGNTWAPFAGGLTGTHARAVVVTADGDVVVGGDFSAAGATPANNIARWDGTQWHALGTGTSDWVTALAVRANGDIIAGGNFLTAGGVAANHIARWDGSQWHALGEGLVKSGTIAVRSISELPSGELAVAGSFNASGATPLHGLAFWNGTAWSSPLVEPFNGTIATTGLMPNGELLVGGNYEYIQPGIAAWSVAKWDGAAWSGIAQYKQELSTSGQIFALEAVGQDEVVAGGMFDSIGNLTINGLARWDGTAWSPLGSSGVGIATDTVQDITVLSDESIVASGRFTTIDGVQANHIARWNGSTWSALGTGIAPGNAFAMVLAATETPSHDIIAGGDFLATPGFNASYIARWDGQAWSAVGAGLDKTVRALTVLKTGQVVAGGDFGQSGPAIVHRIASWNGASWSPVGLGLNGAVHGLITLKNGDLIAGGQFSGGSNFVAQGVARWDGSKWQQVGDGLWNGNPRVMTFRELDNGDLLAGGRFATSGSTEVVNLARWDGRAWTQVEGGPVEGIADPVVYAMAMRTPGELMVGGYFQTAGPALSPRLARLQCSVAACYADCDVSGSLNIDDFVCFQTLYAIGDPQADCDASGALNIDDFVCFQTSFAVGC